MGKDIRDRAIYNKGADLARIAGRRYFCLRAQTILQKNYV
jgi:hypothetical protein